MSTTGFAPFRRHPARFLADPEAAATAVTAHLARTSGCFDTLTADSDPARIQPVDLVAVSMTEWSVPPPAAAWILGEEGQWLTTEILAEIPADRDLWDCDAHGILRAADLFALLRARTSQFPDHAPGKAMSQATATWVLAAKRPRLCPVDDRVIRKALRYDKDGLWFRRWQQALDPELQDLARRVREIAAEEDPVAASLSELRILDIVIRRRSGKARG